MDEKIKIRFEKKIIVTPGCWIWTAFKEQGYGKFNIGPRMHRAHRISYQLYVAEIPDGMHVLHRCDNPGCVNPDHLFLGTNSDNMADKVNKGRQSKGVATGTAKLSAEQVKKIKTDGRRNVEIAREYGVGHNAISDIKLGKKWRHI